MGKDEDLIVITAYVISRYIASFVDHTQVARVLTLTRAGGTFRGKNGVEAAKVVLNL